MTKIQDLSSIGIASITGTVITALFWLFLAGILSTEQYGEISYYLSIAGISLVVSLIGTSNTVIVYTAKEIKIITPIYFISIVSSVIASLVIFFMFYEVGTSLYIIGGVIFGLATAEALGRKAYKDYAKIILIQKGLMILLSIIFYYIFGFHGIILGIALSFFPFVFRIFNEIKTSKIIFSSLIPHMRVLINNYLLELSGVFSVTVDKLIISVLFGYALLGNYQLGFQVLSILGTLPMIVYKYVLPRDASGLDSKKIKILLIILSFFIMIVGITLSPIIISIIFPKFTDAIEVIQILSFSILPGAINLMYVSKFLGDRRGKFVLIGSGIFISVQLTTIAILGNIMGINGIAMSYVVAMSSESCYFILVKRFKYRNTKEQ